MVEEMDRSEAHQPRSLRTEEEAREETQQPIENVDQTYSANGNETQNGLNRAGESSLSEESEVEHDSTTYFRIGTEYTVEADAKSLNLLLARIPKIENLDNYPDLEALSLCTNFIEKLENLENVSRLRTLELYQNKIKKIENIDHLVNLTLLDLSFNRIRVIEGLGTLKNLTKLYLSSNKITEIRGLETLTNLELLELGNNRISVIENIENLTKLSELWLGKNKITEMVLPPLPQLKQLSIQSNRLDAWNESIFENAPNLEELYLSHNRLSAIPDSIRKLTSLRWLDLAGNKITSLSAVTSLPGLTELWLNDNCIEDFEEVKKLKPLLHLETVYLEGNPIKQKLGPAYRQTILGILTGLTQLDAITVGEPAFRFTTHTSSKDQVKPIMKH